MSINNQQVRWSIRIICSPLKWSGRPSKGCIRHTMWSCKIRGDFLYVFSQSVQLFGSYDLTFLQILFCNRDTNLKYSASIFYFFVTSFLGNIRQWNCLSSVITKIACHIKSSPVCSGSLHWLLNGILRHWRP